MLEDKIIDIESIELEEKSLFQKMISAVDEFYSSEVYAQSDSSDGRRLDKMNLQSQLMIIN